MNKEISNIENKIDYRSLILTLKSKWYYFIISLLVGSLCGILYYGVISTPKYESSAMIYLRTNKNKLSLDSLQVSSSLTDDYKVIFLSRINLSTVKKDLKLPYSVDQLRDMTYIDNPQNTRILKVTVTSKDSNEATRIANKIVNIGMNDIREIDSQEPFLIENAIDEPTRIGFTLLQVILLGAFIGIFICLFIVLLLFKLRDEFTSSDDVENTLGLPVLAVIAEDQSLTYAKLESSNSRRRKHHGKKTSK